MSEVETLSVDSPLLDPSKVSVRDYLGKVFTQVIGIISACWLISFIVAILMIYDGELSEMNVKSTILAVVGSITGFFIVVGIPGLLYRDLYYEGLMIDLRRRLFIVKTGRELPPIIRNWNSWLINVCASRNLLPSICGVFTENLPIFTLVPSSALIQRRPVWIKITSHSPPFYYNRITKDRQWECPPEFDGADDVSRTLDYMCRIDG